MTNLNQSAAPPQAFPSQPACSDRSLGSQQRREAVWHRTVLMLAAWLEIIVGASSLLAPTAQSQFIFGGAPEAVSILFTRFAGIALIGLGIACLPSNPAGAWQGAVQGLFVFNLAVTIFFAWVAVATTFRGVMLGPVVILHVVITIALARSLRHKGF